MAIESGGPAPFSAEGVSRPQINATDMRKAPNEALPSSTPVPQGQPLGAFGAQQARRGSGRSNSAADRMRMPERALRPAELTGTRTEQEALEVLLSGVVSKNKRIALAHSLIRRFGSLARTLSAPLSDLMTLEGVGPSTVVYLQVVKECALALLRGRVMDMPLLRNWDALIDYLTASMAHEPVEQMRVLFLDPRNCLIADELQQTGAVNFTPVYPREIIKRALELHATALIIVHNHPSGNPEPSTEDLDMTASVAVSAAFIGIMLHDHIIIGTQGWVSLRRQGLLRNLPGSREGE